MVGPVRVEGLRELERAFKLADRAEQRALRATLKQAAEPVRLAAESKALARIRNVPRSPQWATMRVGQSRSLVYMVPKQRPSRRGRGRRRPNFARLLATRAMHPALEENVGQVSRRVQLMLDTVGRQWERV